MSRPARPTDDMLRAYARGDAPPDVVDLVERALFEDPRLLGDVLGAELLQRALHGADIVSLRRTPDTAPMRVRERFAWAASLLLAVGVVSTGVGWRRDTAELAQLREAGYANVEIVAISPERGSAPIGTTINAGAGGWLFEVTIEPPFAATFAATLADTDGRVIATVPELRPDREGRVTAFIAAHLQPARTYTLTVRASDRIAAQHIVTTR